MAETYGVCCLSSLYLNSSEMIVYILDSASCLLSLVNQDCKKIE